MKTIKPKLAVKIDHREGIVAGGREIYAHKLSRLLKRGAGARLRIAFGYYAFTGEVLA